jgi:hypothetical protein
MSHECLWRWRMPAAAGPAGRALNS